MGTMGPKAAGGDWSWIDVGMTAAIEVIWGTGPVRTMVVVSILSSRAVVRVIVALASVIVVVSVWTCWRGHSIVETFPSRVLVKRRVEMLCAWMREGSEARIKRAVRMLDNMIAE